MKSEGKTRAVPQPPEARPYLIVRDGAAAMAFYARAFGAEESMRIPMADGKLGHAEFAIAGAKLMLADEFPSMDIVGPATLGGTSVSIHVYVQDVDAFAARAIEAGAKLLRPIIDEFFGERVARLEDPFGHRWTFATRIEELTAEEVMQRAKGAEPEGN
jgi:PhnB protein